MDGVPEFREFLGTEGARNVYSFGVLILSQNSLRYSLLEPSSSQKEIIDAA